MKHRLFILALFLLLGAIVNVAVAWGCAVRWDEEFSGNVSFGATFDESTNLYWTVDVRLWFGTSKVRIQWAKSKRGNANSAEMKAKEAVPYWVGWKLPRETAEQLKPEMMPRFVAHGWPFRSLLRFDYWYGLGEKESYYYRYGEKDSVFEKGITTTLPGWIRGPEPVSGGRSRYTHLPLLPIWQGFLGNTLIYSWLLLLLWLGVVSVRKRIRINRGLCIKCGYDLCGSTSGGGCPECGWEREAEA